MILFLPLQNNSIKLFRTVVLNAEKQFYNQQQKFCCFCSLGESNLFLKAWLCCPSFWIQNLGFKLLSYPYYVFEQKKQTTQAAVGMCSFFRLQRDPVESQVNWELEVDTKQDQNQAALLKQ